MATLVQSNEQITNATGSTTLAFGSNITAGSCVVAETASFGSALNLHTDNNGGVYRTPPNNMNPTAGGVFLRRDIAPNHNSGATTVTIDPTGTGDVYIVIQEWSGVDTLQPIDMARCGTNTGTGTAVSAGSTGTFDDDDERVNLGFMSHAGLDTDIAEDSGNGWTLIQENAGGSANCPGSSIYKITTATTAQTPAWTLGGSQQWIAIRCTLRTQAPEYPYLVFPVGGLSAFASGTTITTTIPSHAATGDYMVLAQMANGSTTFSTPTDWNPIGTAVESNANQSSEFYENFHDGSESNPASTTSATMSGTLGGYGRIWVFENVDTSTPTEDITMAGTPTSDNNPDSATIDTTGAKRLAVCFLVVDDDNTWSSGMPPTDWMNAGPLASSATGGDAMFDAIMREIPAAATVSAVTIGTMSAADFWRSMTLALIPAAAGPLTLDFPHLSSTSTLHTPTLTVGAVNLDFPHLSSTSTLHTPTLTQNIVLPHLDSTSQLHTPTLTAGAVNLDFPHLASTSALHAPTLTVGAVNLDFPHLASASQLHAPTLSQNIVLPHLSSSSTLHTPTLTAGAVNLDFPHLGSTSQLHAPSITVGAQFLTFPHLDSTSALHTPTLTVGAVNLAFPHLGSSSQLHAPTLTLHITLPHLASSSALHAMVLTAGVVNLTFPHLDSTSQLHPMSIVRAGDDLIDICLVVGTIQFVLRVTEATFVGRTAGAPTFVPRSASAPEFVPRAASAPEFVPHSTEATFVDRDAGDPVFMDRSTTLVFAHGQPGEPTLACEE